VTRVSADDALAKLQLHLRCFLVKNWWRETLLVSFTIMGRHRTNHHGQGSNVGQLKAALTSLSHEVSNKIISKGNRSIVNIRKLFSIPDHSHVDITFYTQINVFESVIEKLKAADTSSNHGYKIPTDLAAW
jgi:hypothetical protein